jgi:NADH-quinone oxidoreductase subunit L
MTFHGPERFAHAGESGHGAHDAGARDHAGAAHDHAHETHDHAHDSGHDHAHGGHDPKPHESPWVVTVPLIMLAIPSVIIGFYTVAPVLFGNYFGSSIFVLEHNNVVEEIAREFHGPASFALHAFAPGPFWLAVAGFVTAYLFFLRNPSWADAAERRLRVLYTILVNKYYFDWFNENVVAPLARGIGRLFWKGGDEILIDGVVVNGSARGIGLVAAVVRHVQSGYLYHYAFVMIIGLSALLAWLLTR